MFGEFEYVPAAEETILLYVEFPPYYRPFYSFKADRWEVLD
jgi:hypothetical protein